MRKQYQVWIAIVVLLLLNQITIAQDTKTDLEWRVWIMDVNQPTPKVVYTSRNNISLFGFSKAGNLLIESEKTGELLELFLDNLLPYVKQVPKPAEVFVEDNKIWVRYPSGEKKQVVDGYPNVSQPILAPDETKLLFTVKDKTSESIWIANIDGTKKQRIYEVKDGDAYIWLKNDGSDLIPAQVWSPDGNKFCFYASRKVGDNDVAALAITDIKTGNIIQLPDSMVIAVTWSSNGNRVAYKSRIPLYPLYVYDLKKGTLIRLPADEGQVGLWSSYSLSPKGDKIACNFSSLTDDNEFVLLRVLHVQNGKVEYEFDLLKTIYAEGDSQIVAATKWFPKGDKLAFLMFRKKRP